MNIEKQIVLENIYSRKNTHKYLKRILDTNPEVMDGIHEKFCNLLSEVNPFDLPEHMENVITFLQSDSFDELEVLERLHTYLMAKNQDKATIQEVISVLSSHFKPIEREHGIQALLNAVTTFLSLAIPCTPMLTDTVEAGRQTTLNCVFPLPDEVADIVEKQGYVLPSVVPLQEVLRNTHSGYYTFEQSVMLGGKHHDKEVCLAHINRVNATPFTYEKRLPLLVEPTFSFEPKVNKKGRWETTTEIAERYIAWKQLHEVLPKKLAIVMKETDTFYLTHGYCTRGRTYVRAYEYNYQGSSYLKAMIECSHKERVEPEF